MSQVEDQIFENLQETPTANNFLDCEFISCDFLSGDFSNKSFQDCCFFGCDLMQVGLANTQFTNCRFKDCQLNSVDFGTTKELVDVNFDNCTLKKSTESLKNPSVKFSDCTFSG